MRTFSRKTAAAVLAVSLLAAACGGGGDIEDAGTAEDAADDASAEGDAGSEDDSEGDDASGGEMSAELLGAGASFPDPVYQTWIGEYTQNVQPGVSIQYESIGSGGGREQFIGQQTDFAGSDAFMSDEEMADAVEARGCGEVLHIPTVFGGVVVAYNIEELADEELVLDAAAIADIFSGEITNANDPAIAELNPDLELPDVELVPTVRADGSGTTSIFTTYLEDEDEDWASEYGAGDEVGWYDGVVAGEQNDGVQAAVDQQPGGIGYLSLEFAVAAGLPFASVVNADGNAIVPSTETVGNASDGIDLPDDLRFNILGVGGEGYPIAGATWVLAYTCGMEENKAEALRDYLTWALTEGDDLASELGYAPLGAGGEEASLANVERINEEG
jgi:phosphate transport system substrate-binding protein